MLGGASRRFRFRTLCSGVPIAGHPSGNRPLHFLVHGTEQLVLLFASLLAITLASQSRLYALLLARLQVVGVTLDFLDDVFLLNLPLKPA